MDNNLTVKGIDSLCKGHHIFVDNLSNWKMRDHNLPIPICNYSICG